MSTLVSHTAIDLFLGRFVYGFGLLISFVFAVIILRARKPAANAMAWLLVIIGAPYVGVPLYLLLGVRKIPSRFSRRSGLTELRGNKSLLLLETGEAAFESYIAQIKAAKTSIYVSTFIFGNDNVGRTLLELLTDRAFDGIDVRVIVDSLGAMLIRLPSLRRFRLSGGKISFFMPFFHFPFHGRANFRNHRKLLITDGRIAIVGGMNLTTEYMGPEISESRWKDLAIQIQGESVQDLKNTFLADWNFAAQTIGQNVEVEMKATLESSGALAQVIDSGPDVDGDPLYDVMLSSIYEAKHEILIATPYFIPDEALTKALELAIKRGIAVEILVPRHSNHFLADIARGSFIRQLIKSGAKFSFYLGMMHAKVFLVDGKIGLLGSANFDMRSLLVNFELGLLIYDGSVLAKVRLWFQSCKPNSTSNFSRETVLRQIAEGIGRIIGPLI